MRNITISLLALFTLFIGTGCPKPAIPAISYHLFRPFALKIGQTAQSEEAKGLSITFDQVSADSRCPIGVQCITAGKADVVLTLKKDGETQTATLPFTLPTGTSNVVDFKGFNVRIVGVNPLQVKDKPLDPASYEVTILVIETPPPGARIKVGEPFSIGIGESLALESEPASKIRFDSMVGDSRCPEGVKCIWAGKVDCVFSVTVDDLTKKVMLSTGDMSQGGLTETKFGSHTLEIKSIAPPKKQGEVVDYSTYKATLLVRE